MPALPIKSLTVAVALLAPVALSSREESSSKPIIQLAQGLDDSAGNLSCFIVSTPTATYYLEKKGGGLSSMIDKDGVDWIAFHKETDSQSKGEYRGFPNAIHRQDGNYFHPLNAATEESISEIEARSNDHVRIRVTSGNGKWQGLWDFYPDRCDFTMTEVSQGYQYWILYEGVPGGSLDKSDFWYSSSSSDRRSIDDEQLGDLPGPEWIAFGDQESPRMLFLSHHEDDSHPDKYYSMRGEMTVFGFGREGMQKFLDTPQRFSIGFVETKDYAEVQFHVENPPQVTTP